ncbi:MAG TPA: alpha/beta fold hydrolase [Pirellulales bacterium]|nr:alpha/beta fold hydrolase [Pirellulales bacterium]
MFINSLIESILRGGFDFLGFDGSGRYAEMSEPADAVPPLGRAELASRQIEAAAAFILAHHGAPRLSLIAHSWGTIAAGCFAARRPDLVERLAFFGPISRRTGQPSSTQQPASRLVSLEDQWKRFVATSAVGAPFRRMGRTLLWRWPQMRAFIEQTAPGSMFELSINRRTGFVPLAIK